MSEENIPEEISNQDSLNENISQEHYIEEAEPVNKKSDITTSDISNMETHAHELHKAPGHGWKHYLFEFFMLFLAVFCGFLAENLRESMVEHEREKEYIKSFAEDLKKDAVQLKKIINTMDEKIRFRDSLLAELANPDVFKNSARAYYFLVFSFHFPDFIYNDRTIQQLKNGGGMRLIRDKPVSDGIMDYDSKVRTLFIAQQQMNSIALTDGYEVSKVFQKRLLDTANKNMPNPPVPLLIQTKVELEEFYNNMKDQKLGFIRIKELDVDLLSNSLSLIQLIQKEYQLENE